MRRQIWPSFHPPGWGIHSSEDSKSWIAAWTNGHTNGQEPRWLYNLQCLHRGGRSPSQRGRRREMCTEQQGFILEAGQTDLVWHRHGKPHLVSTHMDSGIVGFSALISSFTSHRQQRGVACREKGGEATLGAGRAQEEQRRVKRGSWITTAGAWDCLSAKAKEILLEQDNLSCSDRVNFKLAESFSDFFTSTVKSLGLVVTNHSNERWWSQEWWMDEWGWKSRMLDPNKLQR